MKTLTLPLVAAMAAICLAGAARADAMTDIAGRWRDSDGETEIDIARCGQALCGTIVWLKQPRTDAANPDPALKSRSLLGVRVLTGLSPSASSGSLTGEGYNPEDGRSYGTTLELKSKSSLSVKGCVMGGLICDDDIWTRQR